MSRKNVFQNNSMNDMSYLLDQDFITDEAELADTDSDSVTTAPIGRFVEFKNHPFRVDTEDESFQELVDSIKENGLIYPVLARPVGDMLEIIAGHRRLAACRVAEVEDIPTIIKPMDDYEATILMVHSNLYRPRILISEKAKAYRMCMDAERHQGVAGKDGNAALITIFGKGYALVDIFLRMLNPEELKLAQGFPDDYVIDCDYDNKPYSKAEQVRRIGNSVVPIMAKVLVEANCGDLKIGERIPKMPTDLDKMVA